MVSCADCGLPYADFAMDTHVPRAQWLRIVPQEHGVVLCANCILKRAPALIPGASVAHVIFEVALRAAAPPNVVQEIRDRVQRMPCQRVVEPSCHLRPIWDWCSHCLMRHALAHQ
jgi:hypothetical protein